MNRILLLAGVVALFSTGCYRRTVVVHERGPEPVVETVHDDYSGDVWDGERWVVIHGHVHGPHCGHYWHHGAWHIYPVTYVYPHAHCHHWGVVVHVR